MQIVYLIKGSKCSRNLKIMLITVSHMASCNLKSTGLCLSWFCEIQLFLWNLTDFINYNKLCILNLLYVAIFCFIRDHQQITSVMLNRFCALSKPSPFTRVLNRRYQNGWNNNEIKSKTDAQFTLYFNFWRYFL